MLSRPPALCDLPASVEILVVGGGIQGAGIAQAAAAAGYQVLLVERSGWGASTSSKSSKLIHGGLRYLQQFQLGLVRESLRERAILCRIAPHLVRLNDFHIPVYGDSRIRPWQLSAGLSLYGLLGGLGRAHRFGTLPKAQWSSLCGLNTAGLTAVYRYRDGQTDDQLLTNAVVASARQLGAIAASPVLFTGAEADAGGYRVTLETAGRPLSLHCQLLINAAGPWHDQVAERIAPRPPAPALSLVQGSHLVLEPRLSDQCFYLEAPQDGRAVFVLPWRGHTLLGTTETPFSGDPATARCSAGEQAYLLSTLAHHFPAYASAAQVVNSMAGLRVLPGGNEDVHARSREVIFVRQLQTGSGYLAVCGGKLTTYRATAAQVIRHVRQCLGARRAIADTAHLTLPAVE